MAFSYKKKTPRVTAKTPGNYSGDFISLNPKTIIIPVKVKKPPKGS